MANKIHDAFDSIKADPQMVEAAKQSILKKYKKKQHWILRPGFRGALATVCMALVLAVGIGVYSWIQTPVSYVSIDVNPSIELALNRIDRVVSVTAFNTEGAKILNDLPLKGQKYTNAIDMIVESNDMRDYLTDESELVFTVAADSRRESELKAGVERCSGHIEHKSESVSADIEVVPQAHDHGLSLGKYYAYLQLSQYDGSVTVDECKDMSMAEIHGLISEHEHGGEHGQDNEYVGDKEQEITEKTDTHSGSMSDHGGKHHREGEHE